MDRRQFLQLAAAAMASPCALAETTAPHLKVAETARRAARHLRHRTIRLLHPVGCEANLEPVAALFRTLTEIEVELIKGSLDNISSEIRFHGEASAIELPFDLALPATFSLPDLVDDGLLLNLDDWVEHHEPPEIDQQALYRRGSFVDGAFYGYQADGDAYVLFLNPALPGYPALAEDYAQRHGAALETPTSWAELDRQLAHFHRPHQGVYGGALFRNRRYIGWEFWSRLHGNGVYPVDDDFDPQFEGPAGTAALESLIAATDALAPDVLDKGLFHNFDAYTRGDKYFNLGWGGNQKAIMAKDSAVRGKIRHGVLPGGVDAQGRAFQAPLFNWGWNYVVPARASNPELAYLFSLFASLPPVSTLSVSQRSGYFDPHQEAHYSAPDIQQIYGQSFLDTQRHSMRQAIPDFQVGRQESYQRVLSDAVYLSMRGLAPPARALQSAADQWRRLTDRMGRKQQVARWGRLKASYPTAIRQALG